MLGDVSYGIGVALRVGVMPLFLVRFPVFPFFGS